MELASFFLRIAIIFLPPLLLGGISKNLSFMLIGFSVGIVIGIQTNILSQWWITLSVLGLVASVFVGSGGSD